ncbi:MAG: hypothetical protein GF388_04515 [Candidatus Aegiribacteria sp.]|nr:hypothetical protein [Candidatus Aegiribacteria sp.]MBD3294499.1 hypothetical protein [Candidatus Fermentibacteria bacterium]
MACGESENVGVDVSPFLLRDTKYLVSFVYESALMLQGQGAAGIDHLRDIIE